MTVLSEALKQNNYDSDPMLRALGINISKEFTKVDGRVLNAPKLRVGNGEDFFPRNGKWNFNNKKLLKTSKVQRWGVVNFSAQCQIPFIISKLLKCGQIKGMEMENPYTVIEENRNMSRDPPGQRVESMFQEIEKKFPGPPYFLLCILPERKNSDVYSRLHYTSCRLGGINSVLQVEDLANIPLVSRVPTIILGMDVSHGSAGQSDVPSIAAVVSSREWPLITKYRASVRTQSPKVEMIDSLFKLVQKEENGATVTKDEGIIQDLMKDFYASSGKRSPEHIIIFRDGVSESQFNQVLNIELNQIIETCKFLDAKWNPKFTLIIAQKNHQTKFFQRSPDNVPPGIVVDQVNQMCLLLLRPIHH